MYTLKGITNSADLTALYFFIKMEFFGVFYVRILYSACCVSVRNLFEFVIPNLGSEVKLSNTAELTSYLVFCTADLHRTFIKK